MKNNLLNNKKRDVTIDLIKGLCIFLMVAGHAQIPCKSFIYLFHMAVFFIASGYLYNSEKSTGSIKAVGNFIFRKFKSLWFPFVIWTSIFTLCNNLFINLNIYTDNPLLLKYINGPYIHTTEYLGVSQIIKKIFKAFFLLNSTQAGGAFWFISTLMKLLILYCIIDFLVRKIFKKIDLLVQSAISIIFLCVGYYCSLNNIKFCGFEKVCSYYCLITIGRLIRKYQLSIKLSQKSIQNFVCLLVSFALLIILENFGSIALDRNSYVNPVFFIATSFIGWEFCFTLATLIKKVGVLTKIIAYWGKNTMPIIILHFLSFKIVSLIGILIQGKPLFTMAAFPVLYTDGLWWIPYTVAGMTIPLLLNWVYLKVKIVFMTHINKKEVLRKQKGS